MWCGRWTAGRSRRDAGASATEYAGLLLVAALVVGLLVAMVPAKVMTPTKSAICTIFSGDNCGRSPTGGNGQNGATGPGTTNGPGGSSTSGNGGGNSSNPNWNSPYAGMNPANQAWSALGDQIGNFFGGLGNGVKQAAQGLGGAAWDDVKGFGDLFAHPMNAVKGIGHIVTHPVDTIEHLVWDDGSRQAWHDHQPVKAIFRGVWNVGSWFIPGYDLGKLGSKIGKFGKAADEAGKLGKLTEAAAKAEKAADDAERAAKAGDAQGAARAAAAARKDADDAAAEARKNGCKLVGLGPPRLLDHALSFGRFGGPLLLHAPSGDPCRNASEAAAARDRAARAAERAQLGTDINDAVKSGRFDDADGLIDRADANAAAARDAARKDPSQANKNAANEAERFAEQQRQKVIDAKIRDSRRTTGKSPEKIKGDKLEADIADAVRPALRNYNRKYGPNGSLGEVDAETGKAIIESASGARMSKTDQLGRLANNRTINPTGKPVIVVAPNWSSAQIQAALAAGATRVVKNTAELKQALRDLGENIP